VWIIDEGECLGSSTAGKLKTPTLILSLKSQCSSLNSLINWLDHLYPSCYVSDAHAQEFIARYVRRNRNPFGGIQVHVYSFPIFEVLAWLTRIPSLY
jgi:hypothetical protein